MIRIILVFILLSFDVWGDPTRNITPIFDARDKDKMIDINGVEKPYHEVQKLYFDWIKTAKKSEIVWISKYTPYCKTRESMQKIHSFIMINRKNFRKSHKDYLNSNNCNLTDELFRGTLIARQEGSQISQILFANVSYNQAKDEYTAYLNSGYFVESSVTTIEQAEKAYTIK